MERNGPTDPPAGRYRSFSGYLRERYGRRVHKIPVDAGFDCPNRDGTVGRGGCVFCDNRAFSPAARRPGRSIAGQVAEGIEHGRRRFRAGGFIVYFQPNTNTHGSPETIAARLALATAFPDIVAVAVGTRPDCVDGPRLAAVRDGAGGRDAWIEMGVPSARDATLALLDRNHTFADFAAALAAARSAGLLVCAHVILGLPGETADDERETARRIAALEPDGIKIHPLHVVRGTRLHTTFEAGDYRPLTLEEYVRRTADFLELLPPRTVVQRLSADCPADLLAAPAWMDGRAGVARRVAAELAARGAVQGDRYPAVPSTGTRKGGP